MVCLLSLGVIAVEESVDAGITPDSFLWGLERVVEKIQLAFTFDIAKKAELRLKIANERLAEVEVMIEENKLEAKEKAEKARVEEIKELEKLEIENKSNVQEMLQKHITKLEEVKEKVPEEAKKGLETAIVSSSKVLEKIEEKERGERIQEMPEEEKAQEKEGGEVIEEIPQKPRAEIDEPEEGIKEEIEEEAVAGNLTEEEKAAKKEAYREMFEDTLRADGLSEEEIEEFLDALVENRENKEETLPEVEYENNTENE